MLKDKHVIFLGGDARQLEVIKGCIEMNAKVTLIGFDNLEKGLYSGVSYKDLDVSVLNSADVLILPIIGTNEHGEVTSVFTSKKLVLTKEHINALPDHCLVFAGLAKAYLKNLCEKYHIHLIELMERDDVAIYNSIPTVEGALMMAIQNTDITIHGSNCMVLGFGRVGMSLARTLNVIGAKVSVGVKENSDIARAFEMGMPAFYTTELVEQVREANIIFNTVPALILDAPILTEMRHDVLIIDLASKPGGVDYEFAEKRGIKAMFAPSLPGIVAPKSAGKILSQTIRQIIAESLQKEGVL